MIADKPPAMAQSLPMTRAGFTVTLRRASRWALGCGLRVFSA